MTPRRTFAAITQPHEGAQITSSGTGGPAGGQEFRSGAAGSAGVPAARTRPRTGRRPSSGPRACRPGETDTHQARSALLLTGSSADRRKRDTLGGWLPHDPQGVQEPAVDGLHRSPADRTEVDMYVIVEDHSNAVTQSVPDQGVGRCGTTRDTLHTVPPRQPPGRRGEGGGPTSTLTMSTPDPPPRTSNARSPSASNATAGHDIRERLSCASPAVDGSEPRAGRRSGSIRPRTRAER